MPRLINPLGPKSRIIGLSQRIIIMKSSRTGQDLFIMVNSALRPSSRIERQRIQDLTS